MSEQYHGGLNGGVWNEKVFEHFVAYTLCKLAASTRAGDIYIDIAAGGSPWSVLLRKNGYAKAYAVDLSIGEAFRGYEYYLKEDATHLPFPDCSVRAMSLQCAFELFTGDSDMRFIDECARVLAPGGCVVIVPLYMHTHYCGYCSPEHYGRQVFADEGAKVYLCRKHFGIPFSRKYDVRAFQHRILSRVSANALRYQIYEIANATEFGPGIYCHYILRISKEMPQVQCEIINE